jgi:hypothetical protein
MELLAHGDGGVSSCDYGSSGEAHRGTGKGHWGWDRGVVGAQRPGAFNVYTSWKRIHLILMNDPEEDGDEREGLKKEAFEQCYLNGD